MHSLQSNVTPGDFVGSVLGYQGAGINNSEHVGKAMLEGVLNIPRLFGFGDPSAHSYYPCTAGCGNEGFMPEKGNFYTPDKLDKDNKPQSPMIDYYIENFAKKDAYGNIQRDSNGKPIMTIDTSLLPTNNNPDSTNSITSTSKDNK